MIISVQPFSEKIPEIEHRIRLLCRDSVLAKSQIIFLSLVADDLPRVDVDVIWNKRSDVD